MWMAAFFYTTHSQLQQIERRKRMKKKFISIDKMQKKDQKAFYGKLRGSWGGVKPCTKVVESKKVYTRKFKHKGSLEN